MSFLSQCRRLFSIHVRMQLGLSALLHYYHNDRKKFWQVILILLAVLLTFGTVVLVYGVAFGALLGGAAQLDLGTPLLTAALTVSMAATLLFAMFQLSATVFNAKDIEWYAALPVKPGAVFFAKLGMAYLLESAACYLLLIPTYVIYAGTPGGGGPWFWLAAVLSLPLVPLLPMAAAALVTLPISRLTAMMPKRGFVTAVVTFALVLAFTAGAMLIPVELGRMIGDGSDGFTGLLSDNEAILRGVGAVFPPAAWLARALTEPPPRGGLYLLLFAAVSAAVLFAVVGLAGRLYYRSALTLLESSSASTGKTPRAGTSGGGVSGGGSAVRARKLGVRRRRPWAALAALEIKQLFRSPLYTVNSFSGVYFGLMLLLLPPVVGEEWRVFREAVNTYLASGGANQGFVFLLAVLLLSVSGVMNVAASTSVSREGMSFWVGLASPVSPRAHIMGKYLCSLLVGELSMLVTLVCAAVTLPAMIPLFLAALPPVACATAATAGLSMLPDMLRPKLKWDSEAEAMKQNLNSLLGMLVCSPVLAVIGILLVWAVFLSPPVPAALIASTVLCGGMAVGALVLVRHTAEVTYRRMGAAV